MRGRHPKPRGLVEATELPPQQMVGKNWTQHMMWLVLSGGSQQRGEAPVVPLEALLHRRGQRQSRGYLVLERWFALHCGLLKWSRRCLNRVWWWRVDCPWTPNRSETVWTNNQVYHQNHCCYLSSASSLFLTHCLLLYALAPFKT